MTEQAELPQAVEPDESPPSVPEAFAVLDAASANWVVRRIVESRRYADQVGAWAAVEIRRAQRDEQFFTQRYGAQLEAWTRAEIADHGGRRRSVCLPGGTIGFRHERPHLVVLDQSALLAWCRTNLLDAIVVQFKAIGAEAVQFRRWQREEHCPHAKVSEELAKAVLEQHVRNTGECPNGAEIACGEKFFVK